MQTTRTATGGVAAVQRRFFGVRLTALLAGLLPAVASADPVLLLAGEDPANPSFFTFDFGQLGGVQNVNISDTAFRLGIDAAPGTARFVDYFQQVDPIILLGQYSTGNITVLLHEAGGGTYDPQTGDFTSTDVYAIYFDGDLSALGIKSPFILPSTLTGSIRFQTPIRGTITMDWAGEGQIPNPANPNKPFAFSYTCHVNTLFISSEAGDFDADGDVDLSDFAAFQACFAGSGHPPAGTCPAGIEADFDGDGDVDLADFLIFQQNFTGSR